MRRCRVGVWIKQGSRNGRTTPIREGIVPCRPASHAGRERVWGSSGERGQKLGSRWVDQPSQEVLPFLSIRIPPPAPSSFYNSSPSETKKEKLTRFTALSWYPRFPSDVVEAVLLLLFLWEEEYLPSLSESSERSKSKQI